MSEKEQKLIKYLEDVSFAYTNEMKKLFDISDEEINHLVKTNVLSEGINYNNKVIGINREKKE